MASPRLGFSSSAASSIGPIYPSPSSLPPMPATPEERIDQLLDHISPTEETDAARAEVFAFLRSVVDKCFAECKVREREKKRKRRRWFGKNEKTSQFFFYFEAPISSSFDLQMLVEIEEIISSCFASLDEREKEQIVD